MRDDGMENEKGRFYVVYVLKVEPSFLIGSNFGYVLGLIDRGLGY